jgi:hypothetical protein
VTANKNLPAMTPDDLAELIDLADRLARADAASSLRARLGQYCESTLAKREHDFTFVRVDCDYGADGLWNEQGSLYDLESMPLDEALKARIKGWNEWFSATVRPEGDDPYDWRLHRATAVDIARCIVRAQPLWCVVAIDRRIRADLSPGERVPLPGEPIGEPESGLPYLRWKAKYLSGGYAM